MLTVSTTQQLQALITDARTLVVTPADMVLVCDRAILELASGKPVSTFSVAGRTVSFRSTDELRTLRDYYFSLSNGAVIQLAEM